MSRSSLFSLQEFNQLILNASTYMNKIEAFSFKMANSDMEAILSCLSSAAHILTDPTCPILKKLFVLRFVKDTLLLASLPFYLAVLLRVLPWLLQVAKISESKHPEARLQLMGKLLKGDKFSEAEDSKICSTILQLIEEMVKWIGTNIRSHPYCKLQFRSAFRVVLDRLPRVQNFKLSELTFFKADDPNKYQAYYIERESGESEGERIADYITQVLQGVQEGQEGQILEAMAETGDGHVIAALVEELEGSLEVATPTNIHMKMNLIYLANRLVAVGQVELLNQIKNLLLQKVVVITQIIHKHREEFENSAQLISELVGIMQGWSSKCQSLFLPVEVFREAFKVLENYGVKIEGSSQQLQSKAKLGMIHQINKDKLNQLNCDEADSIKRLRVCQYIPVYESLPLRKGANQYEYSEVPLHNYEFISSNKSQSRHSHSSNSLNNNRKEFLEAFSKYPQEMNQLRGNTSEVKELYLQHSNISEKNRLKQAQAPPRPLIMSFKRPQPSADRLDISPQVVFSDSFTSNHKNSPFKNINSQQFINLVNQPSMEMHSEPSYEQQRVILPENTLSKNNFSSKKQSGVSKTLKNSENSQEEKIAFIKDVKDSIKYNDYMLPEKQGIPNQPSYRYQLSKQSSVVSKQLSKPKQEKSSSLARLHKQGSLLKSASRSKVLSPPSRVGFQNNLIHFGQSDNERAAQGKEVAIAKASVQAIQVEKTVAKPKFSFKVSEDSVLTENQTVSLQLQTQNISQSLPIGSSKFSQSANSNSLSGVPDNFMDLLRVKTDRVKVNAFQDKARELEMQIQKVRSKKLILAQELDEKNMMLEKLRYQMPQPKEQLEQENKRLRNAIKAKKGGSSSPQHLYSYSQAVKGVMKHISVTALKEDSKKLLLYSKCRLFKGESIQIGFQAKEGFLTFYLTFLRYVEDCSVKLETNSLIVEEEIDAKMYKLAAGKQIKFKSKLKDYQLLQGEFRLATLMVRYKLLSKQAEAIQPQVPFHLYNLYKFHAPSQGTIYRKSSDWHYCCEEVLSNPHYITDYFPECRKQDSTFAIRGQLDDQLSSCRVIIDANKFLVEYEGVNEEAQLMLVKCVMAIVERSS